MATCVKGSQWQRSLALFQDMQEKQISFTARSFSSAISACAKASLWQRSLDLLKEMWQMTFARNTITFNAAVSSCSMGAQWQAALGLFEAMRHLQLRNLGWANTTATYNALITACEKASQWQAALIMFAAAVMPDSVSCGAAISACEKGTQWHQALHLLSRWKKLPTKLRAISSASRTTYFEFEDPENTTSVIAIRGTSTMLDVLDDMNIWLPAAFMDAFSIVGPKLSDAVAEATSIRIHSLVLADPSMGRKAMARVSTPIYSDGLQKQYFSHLLEDVQRRRDQFPERRLYITGHSLGGGLAKLVAAKVGIPAVTFMAPGLESTSYLVFRQNMIQEMLIPTR
eukprot:g21338.t1